MTAKTKSSGDGKRRKIHEKRPKRRLEEALSAMREKVATSWSQVMFDLGDIGTSLEDDDLSNKMRRAVAIYAARSEPHLSPQNQQLFAEKLWEDWFGPNGLAFQPPKAAEANPDSTIRYGIPMGTYRKRTSSAAKKTARGRQTKVSQPQAKPPKTQKPKVVEQAKPVAPPAPEPDGTGDFWERFDLKRDAAAHERAIAPREKDEEN